MKCGKSKKIQNWNSKKRISRKCLWIIWSRCLRYSLGEWAQSASNKTAQIPKKNKSWKVVSTYWKSRRSSPPASAPTPKWSNSTPDNYLTIWKRIFSCSRTNVSSCWRMLTSIRRMDGRLCLEWPSKAGASASKATRATTQISRTKTRRLEILRRR